MKKETKNHWNPKINEMPDLGHLNDKLLLDILLNIVFGGAGPNDVTARALWINYIRLVDKSVFEYKNARDSLEEYVSTPNKVIYPLFRCISHLENCIDSVKRAVFFARKMRRNKEIPEINKLPLLSDATNKKLRYFLLSRTFTISSIYPYRINNHSKFKRDLNYEKQKTYSTVYFNDEENCGMSYNVRSRCMRSCAEDRICVSAANRIHRVRRSSPKHTIFYISL